MREILGVQLDAKARRITAAHHVRRAMHEVPARAGAGAERGHHALERQLVRARERHGLRAGADDAGAHDLVGGLGGLAGARGTEMFDGLAHRREDRACARSNAAGSPPVMMASVPFCAPSTPPLTGASMNSRRRAARNSSAQRAVSALTVEQSMTSAPLRKPGRQAFDDRADVRIGGDADHDRVDAARRSRRVIAGAWQPSSAASACALSLLRFQTAASSPARWRFFAMGAPMAPRPAKPTRFIGANYQAQAPQRKTPSKGRRSSSIWTELSLVRQPWGPQMDSTALAAVDARLRELGIGQVFALAILARAIHALRVDGLSGRPRAPSCNARRAKLRDPWRRSRRRANCSGASAMR